MLNLDESLGLPGRVWKSRDGFAQPIEPPQETGAMLRFDKRRISHALVTRAAADVPLYRTQHYLTYCPLVTTKYVQVVAKRRRTRQTSLHVIDRSGELSGGVNGT